MKALSPEVSALLDKLYNLRGEDSVLLVEMDRQKNKAVETKTRTTGEKKELQDKIANLEKLHDELTDQGERLADLLSGINRNDYITVLTRLNLDFDPQNLVEKLNKSLPRTIDSVVMDTKKAEKQLAKVEEEMNSAISKIEELSIRRDAAMANQEKLNEYFDLALSGRISITRDSIASLLEQFNFTQEEQREAAKILMFPEDALFQYDEKLQEKEKSGKSISDVFSEAKNAEPISDEAIKYVDDEAGTVEFQYSSVEPEVEETPKEKLLGLLDKNGIDYLDFTGQELDLLINNYNEELIEGNIQYIKKVDIGTEIFVNHAGLMVDSELQSKIDTLLQLGKEPIDIYLNPNVLEKYTKEQLESSIVSLKDNGMDPKNVPLMAY